MKEKDVVSYSSLVDTYAKKGDTVGAERALARMEGKGVAGNVVSSSTPTRRRVLRGGVR